MTLYVDDGTHIANMSVTILILNRVPRQIWYEDMQTTTLTPLSLPSVFTDDDGTIVATDWWFDENVNFDGGIVTMSSPFMDNHSTDENPLVAWATPGWKNVSVYSIDDAGDVSWTILRVEVLNQRPVAIFPRPADGTTNTVYNFMSSSFDPDGNSGNMSHNWTITGIEDPITNNQVNHVFNEPGVYAVTLIVTDERGLESLPKSYTVHIENPLPMPVLSVSEAWLNGEVGPSLERISPPILGNSRSQKTVTFSLHQVQFYDFPLLDLVTWMPPLMAWKIQIKVTQNGMELLTQLGIGEMHLHHPMKLTHGMSLKPQVITRLRCL